MENIITATQQGKSGAFGAFLFALNETFVFKMNKGN
jgi:hypothetical protein